MTTNNEVGAEITNNEDPRCHCGALIFNQPDVNSLMDWSNTPSKTVGIPNTWILLDVNLQSTYFATVIYSHDFIKQILPSGSDRTWG